MKHQKYQHYLDQFNIPPFNRTWPSKRIEQAPLWCSVDLRDGNQALIEPMTVEKKLILFKKLVDIGFKEIEIGFPSASAVEFAFARTLLDGNHIPDDVVPQVLVQAKDHLIKRTIDALNGAKKAVVHLYNSTSIAQRDIVFKRSKEEIIDLAIQGVRSLKQYAEGCGTEIQLQYSPESFTGTELSFAKDICEAVIEEWNPKPDEKVIINLPSTVELCTANVFADLVEWFSTSIKYRDQIILSIHTHNDRGTAIASAELGILAGADRVEGTLFGYGERTGNLDLATFALNLYTQGINPQLNLSDLPDIADTVRECTDEMIHPRHPYIGDLVFTAFSGSHQDAISKALFHYEESDTETTWNVPYIPIDPTDIGRDFDGVIRINGQSGRAGIAHIFKSVFKIDLPRDFSIGLTQKIQQHCDAFNQELTPADLWNIFDVEFLKSESPLNCLNYRISEEHYVFDILYNGIAYQLQSSREKVGIIEAYVNCINTQFEQRFNIAQYSETSVTAGNNSTALSFCRLADETFGFGAALDQDVILSSLSAVSCAMNHALNA